MVSSKSGIIQKGRSWMEDAYPAEFTPLIPPTNIYRVLMRKPEGRRPLGRPRRRWEDYIKMDVQKVGRGGLDWIVLAQDRGR
jgi:hypothetical protein